MKKVLSLFLSLTILFSFTTIALEANSSVISDRINQFVANVAELIQSMDNSKSNTTNNTSSVLNLSNKQLISVGAEITDNATAVNINSAINESTVSANTVWTLTSSTTIMSGTVTVKSGCTLTINSNISGNAVIQKANATDSCWEGNCFVLEEGASLIIAGTASKKIIFNGLNFADNRGAVIKAINTPNAIELTYFSVVNYSNIITDNNFKGTIDINNCNSVKINTCEFTGCVGNNGGALSVENSNVLSKDNYYGKINSGNLAYQYGGGIYIKDCYFLSVNDYVYGNKASYGGGVYVAESSVATANAQFYGVDISSNQAIAYSVPEDNDGETGGSDIGEGPLGSYEENGDGTLDDFPGSISPDDEIIGEDEEVITLGGGMYLASKAKVTTTDTNEVGASTFTINDSIFGNITTNKLVSSKIDSNIADCGAGVYIGSNADVEINGATSVSSNKANLNGGGLYITSTGSHKTVLTSVSILSNTANVGVTPAFSTAENPDIGHGAGVYVSVEEDVITDVNMQMENCSIKTNECTGYGGALYLDKFTGEIETNNIIRSNTMYGNKATYGGGVYITTGVTLPISTFVNNSILKNDATYGGGVYSLGKVNDTNHIRNNTASQGGGLYVASGSYDVWSHNITVDGILYHRTIISNNKATLAGGAGDDIYMPANSGYVSFPGDPAYLHDSSRAAWYTDFTNRRYRNSTPELLSTRTDVVTADGNEIKRYKSTGQELAVTIVRLIVNIDFDYNDVKYVDPWGNDYSFINSGFADAITYQLSLYKINLEGKLTEVTLEEFADDYDTAQYTITNSNGTTEKDLLYTKTENYFTIAKGQTLSIIKLGSNMRVSVTPIFPIGYDEENCVKAVTGSFTGNDANKTKTNIVVDDNIIGKNNNKKIPVVIKYLSQPMVIPESSVSSITYSSDKITSVVYGTEVAVKYYARSTENGQPTAINTTPSEIKKQFVGSDYFDLFANPISQTTDNVTVYKYEDTFSGMISSTGAFLTKTYRGMSNLVDDYCMWTSQASATVGIGERIIPGTDTKYKDSTDEKYLNMSSYHTNAGGVPVSGEKWVTYYDSNMTSITLDSNDEADEFTTNDAFKDVESVTVWLHNTPKTYNVNVYAAKSAADGNFNLIDGLYVSSGSTLRSYNYQTFYGQRFNGELEDEKNTVSELLANYPEIEVGYVDEYVSTAYRIRSKDASGNTINYYFKYWSFDAEGKNIASTSISYAHRITGNVSLYAVYGLEDSSEFTTEGLTLMKNGVDYFYTGDNNETENVRFNVSNSPYNITVTDMYEVSAVFFELDANSTVTEEDLTQAFSDYLNNGTGIDASYNPIVYNYNTIDNTNNSYVEPSGFGRVLFSAEYPCSEIYADDGVTMNKKIVVVSAMKLLDKWTVSSNVVTFN